MTPLDNLNRPTFKKNTTALVKRETVHVTYLPSDFQSLSRQTSDISDFRLQPARVEELPTSVLPEPNPATLLLEIPARKDSRPDYTR